MTEWIKLLLSCLFYLISCLLSLCDNVIDATDGRRRVLGRIIE